MRDDDWRYVALEALDLLHRVDDAVTAAHARMDEEPLEQHGRITLAAVELICDLMDRHLHEIEGATK